MDIPGIPALSWLDRVGIASFSPAPHPGELTMSADGRTDWFNDPTSPTRQWSAAPLVFEPVGDFLFSANVTAELEADFDAGVLFVHRGPDDYAKFCFERSPQGDNTVVSVVTRETSDDSNGPVVSGDSIFMRVARVGAAYAFHSSIDGAAWQLVRLFNLRPGQGVVSIGFMAQAPTGRGCTVRFSDINFNTNTLQDFRNGT